MSYISPEEYLAKHGHKYPDVPAYQDADCPSLCQTWAHDIYRAQDMSDGPALTALEKQITALARLIKAKGCNCPPLE